MLGFFVTHQDAPGGILGMSGDVRSLLPDDVFALAWGTSALAIAGKILLMQLFTISFFALTIPLSAILAERGRRRAFAVITASIFVFGLVMARCLLPAPRGRGDDGAGSGVDGG